MGCYNSKRFVVLAFLNIFFQHINSAPVLDGNGTNASDLNGQKLMEIGKKLNLPKLQMIGKTIENAENEIEAKIEEKIEEKICDLHTCSDWTEWSGCTTIFDQFGSKFRTRRCNINTTICEIDSKSRAKEKVEKDFGICITYCPNGYNLTKNGFCMKLYADREINQADAEQLCQKDGGHLVNIDSELKFEDVNSVVAGFLNVGIWIDGRRKDVSSPWRYIYGSQKGFISNWHSGYPKNISNRFCLAVALYRKGNGIEWHDVPCNNEFRSICEIIKIM